MTTSSSGFDHFFSDQDHYCSGLDNFEVAVITSSVAIIIFVAAEITYKINMSEKSCWYSLKNVVNCLNEGIKNKLSALLCISYLTKINWYASKCAKFRSKQKRV